jgi:hypothetical protein
MTPIMNPESQGGLAGRPAASPPFQSSEAVWSSRTQWGAILAGAFSGIVVLFLMGTLGIALGITASAIGIANMETTTADTAERAATAFTVGATIWFLLTSLVTGLVAGWVLNSTARRDRPYSSFIFGGVTWAVGACILALLAAPGIGGIVSGAGMGVWGTTASRSDASSQMTPRARSERPAPPAAQQQTPSDEEKAMARDLAERATTAATGAAWVILGAQLISIAATMFAAGWNRHTGTRVVTEIRPRPITSA